MPADELLRAARAEQLRLRAELDANPVFQRLRAIERLLETYGTATDHLAPAYARGGAVTAAAPVKPRVARSESVTAQAIRATEAYLRQLGRRAASPDITEVLEAQGIRFGGQKPSTVLASILSHSELFDNVRGRGYGLREWAAAEAEAETRVDALDPGEPEEPSGVQSAAHFPTTPTSDTNRAGSWNGSRPE